MNNSDLNIDVTICRKLAIDLNIDVIIYRKLEIVAASKGQSVDDYLGTFFGRKVSTPGTTFPSRCAEQAGMGLESPREI